MSQKFKIFVKDIILILASIFFSIFILPFFLVLFVCPRYVYRKIVIFFAAHFKPWLYTPLSLNDCIVVWDDYHGRPRNSCCGVFYLKGRPAFADVVGRVEKLVEGRPELSCSLARWMSVYFWKKCEDFSLSNHFSQNDISDPDKFSEFAVGLIDQGYPPENPLWELIYFPNYAHSEYGTMSAILLRFHHTLGDAIAYMALMRDLCDQNPTVDEEMDKILKTLRVRFSLSPWQKLCYVTKLIFVTPSQAVYYYLKGITSQMIPMPRSKTKYTASIPGVTHVSTLLDISVLKSISKKTGVKVTSIIHAGVTGAMRRMILERGGRADGDLSTIYVLPKTNHPGSMTNNSFGMPLISPMTPEPSQAARLARISKQFDHLLVSPLFLGMMSLADLTGLINDTFGLTTWPWPPVASFIHSNFAFVGEPMKLFGHVAEIGIIYSGLQAGGQHLCLATTSYNGKLGIQLTGSRAIFPERADLRKISDYIREEFEILGNHGDEV